MMLRDKILRIFFTARDLGERMLKPEREERRQQQNVIAQGAESRALMTNPVFQSAVGDLYLHLEAELDSLEPTQGDYDSRVQWILAQRRALRQVCALLDNKIAAQEQLETTLKETQE
jgi:hypothetical protein